MITRTSTRARATIHTAARTTTPTEWDATSWPTQADLDADSAREAMDRLAAPVTGSIPMVSAPTAKIAHDGAVTAMIQASVEEIDALIETEHHGDHPGLERILNRLAVLA